MIKKINFYDFSNDFNKYDNDFMNILNRHFDVVISDDPDYIFYSNFGYEHVKYNCVKIFFTGENITPNFNLCDYAIGFDEISFNDRYLRYPLYKMFQYRKDLINALSNINSNKLKPKTKFCAFVVSNDVAMPERKNMFELLNKYKKISSGGKYLNNVGGPVKDKIDFQSSHKFTLAFENSSSIGYTTEKIVQAFASGSIPIYYGNPHISREFNDKAFINCHNYDSFEDVIDIIKKIDNDDTLYQEMLNQPPSLNDLLDESTLEHFLLNIFSQEPANAIRRVNNSKQIEQEEIEKKYAKHYKKMLFRKKILNFFRRIKSKSL